MTIPPFLSVIVPAHNAAHHLKITLTALEASDIPRRAWELIVVDDASTDETVAMASEFADTIVRLSGSPHGPAYARNRGAEVSRGDILVFVDADVTVHNNALGLIANCLASQENVASVFGSYDSRPSAPGTVSRYRNLLHHYVHHQQAGDAQTFWAGLGAIRRSVFEDAGRFDEFHYTRPQIEDIEFGRRIRRLGYRIQLRPDIQGTHRKQWTLWDVIRTDFSHRGVPWMWLMLKEGKSGARDTLNVNKRERICTALVGLAVLLAGTAAVTRSLIPLGLAGGAVAASIVLNRRLYLFLARTGGVFFALASLLLHLMYYLSNGFSAVTGWAMHLLLGSPWPRAEVAALSQMGIETWPPIPQRPKHGIWTSND